MASFINNQASALQLTDENGVIYHFPAGETRTGLSNYFSKYTSAHMTRPLLTLVGSLDGDGSLPAPGIGKDNVLFEPGISTVHSYTAAPTDALNPSVGPVDISGAAGPRSQRVIIDNQNETSGEARRINANFLGANPAPTLRHATNDLAISGLNAAKTATVETGYFPVAENGVKATAADAAANPALVEGDNYTAFGVITVTDASPSQTGTYYFALKGTSDISFVAAASNAVTLPVPVVAGSAIVLSTGVLTLATFTGGASGDGAEVDMVTALNPDTAAKLKTVLDAAGTSRNGFYYNAVSNRLFLVHGSTVNAFHGDATATLA